MKTLPVSIRSLNTSFIMAWKVAGELVKPKNITQGSNMPWLVLNVAFHSSPSLIRTLLYPQWTSNLVKRDVSWSLSMTSDMRGSGYWFQMVLLFSGVQWINFTIVSGVSVGFQVNSVVIFVRWGEGFGDVFIKHQCILAV